MEYDSCNHRKLGGTLWFSHYDDQKRAYVYQYAICEKFFTYLQSMLDRPLERLKNDTQNQT